MAYGGGAVLDPLPANKAAWRVLTHCLSQWRSNFQGHYGMDLLAVIEVARALHIEITGELFDRIWIFEQTALKIFRKEPFCDEKEKELCSLKYGDSLAWACDQRLCGQ